MVFSDDDYELKDCMSCANAFVDDENFLHCVMHEGKIVNDNDVCDDWNG